METTDAQGIDRSQFDGTIESAVDLIAEPIAPPEDEEKTSDAEASTTDEDPEAKAEDSEEEAETEEDPEAKAEDSEEETEDDDTDTESDDQEEPEDTLFTVSVDGEERQVTLDDLKRGYSGNEYVQKGMREAAEARREAEKVHSMLTQERQQLGHLVSMIQTGQLVPPPAEPDPKLMQSDPVRYMEERIAYDDKKATYDQQMEALQQQATAQSEADQKAMETYLNEQRRMLLAAEPDFGDPDKAAKLRQDMIEIGDKVYGYAEEEILGIVDARAARVFRDAMRYHDIIRNKDQAKERVKRKTVKARAKPKTQTVEQAQRRKQRDRLRRSGSIEDAVGLI